MKISTLHETKFLKLFDLEYQEGRHYFNVSRRTKDNLMCAKSDDEFKKALPDAVSMAAVLYVKGKEPVLVLSYEYRYPAGQFLLSPPAGLIDPSDVEIALKTGDNNATLKNTAIRELKEEFGLDVEEHDKITILSPLLFSSPGMTDESNALVLIELFRDEMPEINQDGAEGTELFDGYLLLTRAEAEKIITQGCDEKGNYFSVFTWAVLNHFVNRL